MRLVSLSRAAALALAALLLGASARADDLDAIRAAKTLRIGTEGTYAPFTFHDASGALVGFDVEIGRKVAEKLGVTPQFLEGKWDGLIAGLDAKRYDVVINQVGITKERQAKFDFSEPYIRSRAVLIIRADRTDIKSFADLKGKKTAQSLTSNFARLAEQGRGRPRRHGRVRPVDPAGRHRAGRRDHQRQPVVPRLPQAEAERPREDRRRAGGRRWLPASSCARTIPR